MPSILDLKKQYASRIAPLDMELLFSFVLEKPREFVLAHPEHQLSEKLKVKSEKFIQRRIKGEPIAYIMGKKEFYGLEFKVTKDTLIPRPETELMVDLALEEVRKHLPLHQNAANGRKATNIFWCGGLHTNVSTHVLTRVLTTSIIDVGTGSGNIIIALAKHWTSNVPNGHSMSLLGIDISKKALAVAKQNAKTHKLDKKIKFIEGNLLIPLIKDCKLIGELDPPAGGGNSRMIILANLPYLSSKIYADTPKDVKFYEPKTALYSPQKGLEHYSSLLKQICVAKKDCSMFHISCYMEISPEQKSLLQKTVKKILPQAKTAFYKDLAGKWRICRIEI